MTLDKINDLLDLNSMCITDHPGSVFCINFLYMDRTSRYNLTITLLIGW